MKYPHEWFAKVGVPKPVKEVYMDAFLSHSSENKSVALRLERDLTASHFSVWIDSDNIMGGGLLLDAIQDAIKKSRIIVLLWSGPASKSRWVNSEWQAAYHLEKPIIPCRLDETELPPFLLRLLSCDFRKSYAQGSREVVEALGSPLEVAEPSPSKEPGKQLGALIAMLTEAQSGVINTLVQSGPIQASAFQTRLDQFMEEALKIGATNAMVLNLAGYHKKNGYMIKHWEAIQKRQSPKDSLLEDSEKFFFSSLSIQPDNPSALNGLGSVLMLRRDLDATEFFIRRALARSKEQRTPYPAAEQDLEMVLRLKKEREKVMG